MKILMLLLTVILSSCSSEPEVVIKSERASKSYRPYLLKYVKSQYVIPTKKRLVLLEKKAFLLDEKINLDKLGTESPLLEAKRLEIMKEIESLKLWPVYYKALLINPENNSNKYAEAQEFLEHIKQRYKELNGHDFPDVEQEFLDKYGEKMSAQVQ